MSKNKAKDDASEVEAWVNWAKGVKNPKREKTWKYLRAYTFSGGRPRH